MPPKNTSSQNPIGNSKAAKFVASNPLDPLANPFANLGDDEKEIHKEVSNNVQERLTKAMDELKEKHRKGTNPKDDADRAPTGAAYKELHQHQVAQAKTVAAAREQQGARDRHARNAQIKMAKEQMRRLKFNDLEKENADDRDSAESESEDDDDEYGHLIDDDDDALQAMRQARMAQIKHHQTQRAAHISLGHGSLRTITQDEFLPECTGSSRHVVVHFFHDDFERCKIMDYHLAIIARGHLEAKFLRIDVAKSPFFVDRLRIETLPALFVFDDGKRVAALPGFQGLARDAAKPDEWHTGRLEEWISGSGAIRYTKPTEEVEEEMKRLGIVVRGSVYSNRERSSGAVEDEY